MVYDRGRYMAEKSYKICLLVVSVIFFFTLPPTWAGDTVDQILNGIHERYKPPGGLVLTYRREVKTKTMSMLGSRVKGDLASGKIFVLPPALLRVEQDKPRKETLLTDGESLWWIIPEEKIVHQYSSDQFGQELRIIADLWQAPSRLKKRFHITALKDEKKDVFILKMVPSPPWEQVDRILVHVSADFALNVLEMVSPLGTTTTFYFDAIEPAQLTSKSFRFVVPDGFKVVHE